MPRRTSPIFGKVLLMSTGVGWSIERLSYNADEVEKKRRKRISTFTASQGVKLSDFELRAKKGIEMNFLRNHQHDHILNYDIDHYCKNWNQLIRDFDFFPFYHEVPVEIRTKDKKRTLKLVLRPTSDSTSPFSSDLVVIQDGERISSHTHPFLFEGYVKGDPHSRVYGSLIDGVFDGHIHLSDGSSYTVENVSKWWDKSEIPVNVHSAIYQDKQASKTVHEASKNDDNIMETKLIETVSKNEGKEEMSAKNYIEENKTKEDVLEQEQEEYNGNNPLLVLHDYNDLEKNTKKQKKICTMHLKLYKRIFAMEGKNDPTRTHEQIISMLYTMMRVINDIYSDTVFNGKTGGIQFVVQQITIETEKNGDHPLDEADLVDSVKFLEHTSRKDHSDFGLSYTFTFRDFEGKFLGRAYLPSHIFGIQGGLCSSFMPFDWNGRWINRSTNTGVITFRHSAGKRMLSRWIQLTFAHEIGHNLGAQHDDHAYPGTVYIMNPYRRKDAFEPPNMSKFSPVTITQMSAALDALERYEPYDPEGKRDYGNKRNCLKCKSTITI